MKTLSAKAKIGGFTLIEVLVVLAVLFILVALLLPGLSRAKSRGPIMCLYNQKSIALSLIMFKDDHAGKYPWQDSATNGGSLEFTSNSLVFPHFQALSEYLGKQTSVLVCPSDRARHAATNFSGLRNENISYFLNLDATTNSASIWTGDRHLENYGKPVSSGLFAYSTNMTLSWTRGFHRNAHNKPMGGLSFADGHAQLVEANGLNSFLQKQASVTNRLVIP